MSPTTVKGALGVLERHHLLHLLDPETIETHVVDGVPHDRWCMTGGLRSGADRIPTAWPAGRRPTPEPTCCRADLAASVMHANRVAIVLLNQLERLRRAQQFIRTQLAPDGEAAPPAGKGVYRKQQTDLAAAITDVTQLLNPPHRPGVTAPEPLTAAEREAANDVLERLRTTSAELNGPRMREQLTAPLLERLRTEWLGTFTDTALDETLTLAAIHSHAVDGAPWAGPNAIHEVIAALTTDIPDGHLRRLRAPRWAIDAVIRALGATSVPFHMSTLPVGAHLAGLDPEQAHAYLELIEQLWQPGIPGGLVAWEDVHAAAAALRN